MVPVHEALETNPRDDFHPWEATKHLINTLKSNRSKKGDLKSESREKIETNLHFDLTKCPFRNLLRCTGKIESFSSAQWREGAEESNGTPILEALRSHLVDPLVGFSAGILFSIQGLLPKGNF